jgi:hypothetical protein
MLQSELISGASLEALALLLASSCALAGRAWREGWLPGSARAEAPVPVAVDEGAPALGSAVRRRAEALRPRGRSRCLSRDETPPIVRIRGQ